MAGKLIHSLKRVARWFLRAPFENLPREYGDPVPPELREFEAEAEASQRKVTEVESPEVHQRPNRPA